MRSEPLGGLSGSTAVGNAWLGQLKDGLQVNQVLYPMVNYQDSMGQYMLSLEVGWAEAETALNDELKKAATAQGVDAEQITWQVAFRRLRLSNLASANCFMSASTMQMDLVSTYKEVDLGYNTKLKEAQRSYVIAFLFFTIILAAMVSIFVVIRFRLKRNLHNL